MAKTFRVGILGDQDEAGVDYFGFKYGVEVFDLTTNQICNLLENTDVNKSVQTTHSAVFPAPLMTYTVFGGGRFFPGISREELSKTVEGMEILIARMNNANYAGFLVQDFFEAIFTENLSDKCKMVIARIAGPKATFAAGMGRNETRRRKTSEFLRDHGLDIEKFKYKGKFFIVTDKSKSDKGKKQSKGEKVSIDRVRSELSSEEFKVSITQPVKETVTAGKAIVRLGARIGLWFSSLIKTH